MRGVGTAVNVLTVLAGTTIGLLVSKALPRKVRDAVPQALGIFTIALGIRQSLETTNVLIMMGGISSGVLVGSWLRLDERLEVLLSRSERLVLAASHSQERSFALDPHDSNSDAVRSAEPTPSASNIASDPKESPTEVPSANAEIEHEAAAMTSRSGRIVVSAASTGLADALVLPSLVFCVGPMTLLGAIQDGANGQPELLIVKAVMDGFASVAFAAGLGAGVYLSAAVILVFQGGLTLAASLAAPLLTERIVAETTAVGGLIVLAIGIKLLKIKELPVVDYLPALVTTPLIVAIVAALR